MTARPEAGRQVAQTLDVQLEMTWRYWLYLPQEYDEQASFPLLLFLHGAGERSDDELDLVAVHGPPKLANQGRHFPFIIVAPQCKAGGWWEAAELSALLDSLVTTYRVDTDRIYATGLSMGGYGVWSLAMRDSDRLAAIAPICGGGNALAAGYTGSIDTPTWCFHGAKDDVVPLSESQEMVDVLTNHGVEVKFTIYPDAEHDSWTDSYDNPELYDWLLSHRLSTRTSQK